MSMEKARDSGARTARAGAAGEGDPQRQRKKGLSMAEALESGELARACTRFGQHEQGTETQVAVALQQDQSPGSTAWLCRGHRGAFEHPVSPGWVGKNSLGDQAGLPHARFANEGHPPGRGPTSGCSRARRNVSNSCRPIKRVSPRAAAACKRRCE